jgi:hypothetical protein
MSASVVTPNWFGSIVMMRRIARAASAVAIVGLGIGVWTGTTNLFVAVPGFFVGAAGVACAMFAWFRVDHLRGMGELRR